jgi:hypothetical protein
LTAKWQARQTKQGSALSRTMPAALISRMLGNSMIAEPTPEAALRRHQVHHACTSESWPLSGIVHGQHTPGSTTATRCIRSSLQYYKFVCIDFAFRSFVELFYKRRGQIPLQFGVDVSV